MEDYLKCWVQGAITGKVTIQTLKAVCIGDGAWIPLSVFESAIQLQEDKVLTNEGRVDCYWIEELPYWITKNFKVKKGYGF